MTQHTLGLMIHRTQASGLLIGSAMDHVVEGPAGTVVESECSPDVARVSIATLLQPGERLRLVKFISYAWSSKRTRPALHDQVAAALTAARLTGWEGLLTEQRAYLDNFWQWADIEIEGDPEISTSCTFCTLPCSASWITWRVSPYPCQGADWLGLRRPCFLG